jgi:putative SOS response-associated peptidase YedK
MCGRYVITSPLDFLRQRFGFGGEAPDYRPRYNLAPRQAAPTVAWREGRMVVMMAWGLVPSWTKELAKAIRPINARAETASRLASFREPFRRSRVLVPATGFFEWRGPRGTKERSPVHFRRRDGEPFAFAGLSDRWQSPDGGILQTFTILTVPPNELVGKVHDRMPAILREGDEAAWLDPVTRVEGALSLLAPYPAEEMEGFDVGREVNSPAVDRPDLVRPADPVR